MISLIIYIFISSKIQNANVKGKVKDLLALTHVEFF